MQRITDWISDLITNFYSQNCISILQMLNSSEIHQKLLKLNVHKDEITNSVQQVLIQNFKNPNELKIWRDFLANFMHFYQNRLKSHYVKSFEFLKESFSSLTEIYKLSNYPAFFSEIKKFYMKQLLLSSNLADQELEKLKEKTHCIDDTGRVLISYFSTFQGADDKSVVLSCIINLIRIHFKLKTYRNSKTLVEWVDKNGLNLKDYKKADVTTFYYYSGRLALYELKIIDAQKIFTNALNICKSNHFNNKKLIIEFLIPLNMFFGKVPTISFIKDYDLDENYINFIEAYKTGNLKMFEDSLEKLEDRFILLGSFLIAEKLKGFVFRNLVKRIHKNSDFSDMKFPNIKIELIYNVLTNVFGYKEMNIEELELYLIGVIYKGLIVGYIHSKDKTLVFSKTNPFPKISEAFEKKYDKFF